MGRRQEILKAFNAFEPHLANDGEHLSFILMVSPLLKEGFNMARAGVEILAV